MYKVKLLIMGEPLPYDRWWSNDVPPSKTLKSAKGVIFSEKLQGELLRSKIAGLEYVFNHFQYLIYQFKSFSFV